MQFSFILSMNTNFQLHQLVIKVHKYLTLSLFALLYSDVILLRIFFKNLILYLDKKIMMPWWAKKKCIKNFWSLANTNALKYLMRRLRRQGITIFLVMKNIQNNSVTNETFLIIFWRMIALILLSMNTETDLLLKNATSKSVKEDI